MNDQLHPIFKPIVNSLMTTENMPPERNAKKHTVHCCDAWCKVEGLPTYSEMFKACKAQHEAIDRLFALLIERDPEFFPTKSGQPWEACRLGNEVIKKVEVQS